MKRKFQLVIRQYDEVLIPQFNVAAFNWRASDGVTRSSVASNTKMTKKMKKEAQSHQGLYESTKRGYSLISLSYRLCYL